MHMKQREHKLSFGLIVALAATLLISFDGFSQTKAKSEGLSQQAIFPKGKQGPAENFTGKAFNYGLLENDTTYNTVVGNVLFERTKSDPGPV
jgi:hypothetical protein